MSRSTLSDPRHYKPTLLIVLGKNIGVGSKASDIRQNKLHLSQDSQINVLAAAQLYRPNMSILFSGGKTAGPDTISEAKAMSSYFSDCKPSVPKDSILLEEKSIDTAGNAEACASILKNRAYDSIYLLSVGYHVGNARLLFERYGVPISQAFASEKLLRDSRYYESLGLDKWGALPRVKAERKKEYIRKLLLHTIDRKGKILRQITKYTRR